MVSMVAACQAKPLGNLLDFGTPPQNHYAFLTDKTSEHIAYDLKQNT